MSQVQTAIDNAANDTYVLCTAGTYNFTGTGSGITIDRDRVELRGEVDADGFPSTIFNWGSGGGGWGLIDIAKAGYPANNWAAVSSRNVTSGLTVGSTQVVLASAPTGLAVGQILTFDAPADENLVLASTSSEGGGSMGRTTNRLYMQQVRVTAISSATVDFEPAIYGDYWDDLGSNQAYWYGAGLAQIASKSGIRNIQILRSSGGGGATHNVTVGPAINCWVKNCYIENAPSGGAHIRPAFALYCQFEDNWTEHHDSVGSATYSIWPFICGSILIRNNIFYDTPCAVGFQSVQGSAYWGNWSRKYPYSDVDYLPETHMVGHGGHVNHNCVEANRGGSFWADMIHGNASFNTITRNLWTGTDAEEAKDEGTVPVNLQDDQNNFCFAGNVLGTQGYHTSYEITANLKIWGIDTVSDFLRIYNWNTVDDAVPAIEAIGASTIEDSYVDPSGLPHAGFLGAGPYYGPDVSPSTAGDEDIPAGYRFLNGVWPAASEGGTLNTTNLNATTLTLSA